MSTPHFLPMGTVYGTLLNFRAEVEALAPHMTAPPYKAPPKAPVLYVKTANTWSPHGSAIAVPSSVPEVEIGASVGMVIGAEGDVEGFVLMNDLSIPHASFFRPPVKFKCLDGFLGIGPAMRDAQDVADPANFRIEVRVNGELKQSIDFSQLVRPAQQLLADVGEFMTLAHGDVLMLGCDAGRPLARAGDSIEISAPGFETLTHTLVQEIAA
ncbi:5-oxopent-3-ene-1,2,5-tricarboxylate decarboxylase/2-hydroxyhepta-2,4-diene-1,7-dioate isomerase [Variovorax boronicumulans]|uniref:fumarylacetoacetate hydrolase family protein n=1 Tax=Variovorax boronicumulans TaxID=436515 RepID=UPI002787B685|nr:fumarylacetoacetate hydrolase family protein [Variovorax boronicumulans]MDQ0071151.1 5-oxopent-3-ene-1,2,5-tricarboxylate decarboxylase/2-hydroxyhepta-2,4-diene-1,7-dioate isomerase [Variovorax boronicumulans]